MDNRQNQAVSSTVDRKSAISQSIRSSHLQGNKATEDESEDRKLPQSGLF